MSQVKKELGDLADQWLDQHWPEEGGTPPYTQLGKLLERACIIGVVAGLEAGEKVEEAQAIAASGTWPAQGSYGE